MQKKSNKHTELLSNKSPGLSQKCNKEAKASYKSVLWVLFQPIQTNTPAKSFKSKML